MSASSLPTVRVGAGGARVRTGQKVRAVSSPAPWGEMRVYVPSKEGLKDVFVLEGRAGPSDDDAPFRAEKPVSLAEQTVRPVTKVSSDQAPAPYFTLFFDWADGTDKEWTAPEARGWTFTLRHRPDGTERSERVVFKGRSRDKVFNGTGERDDYSEGDPFMHTFVGLRVRLSDGVQIAPRAAAGLGYPTGAELHGPHLGETDPLGVSATAEPPPPPRTDEERRETFREEHSGPPAEASGAPSGTAPHVVWVIPAGTRADRTRTWEAGRPVPGALGEPSGSAPGPVAQARAALGETETWVTLLAVRQSPSGSAQPYEVERYETERLGTWKATAEGYDFAHYPDGLSTDRPPLLPEEPTFDIEDLPTAGGAAAPYVLVDADLVETPRKTVFVHVSPYPLPLGRLRRLAADMARGPSTSDVRPGPLTPLYFGSSRSAAVANRTRFEPTAHHADYEDSSWVVYVPDPVRALLRLAEHAEREAGRYQAWTEAAAPASEHAHVVGSATFEGERARDYVEGALAAAPPPGPSWGTFDPAEMVRSPSPERSAPPDTSLGAFQTGHRYAEAYLRHRMDVAAARLEALVSRGPHLTFLEDTYTAMTAPEMPGGARSLAQRVAEAVALADGAMCAAGGGGVVLARRLADPELVAALGADAETCAESVARMEIEEGARWQDVLALAKGAREWRLLWSFGVRGTKAGVAYFGAFSEMTALAAPSAVGARNGAVAAAVVLNRLVRAPAVYSSERVKRVGGVELRRRAVPLGSGRELAFWGVELGEAGQTRLRAFSRAVRTANVVYLGVATRAALSGDEEFTYRDLASVGKLLGEAAALYRDSERSGGALARVGGGVGRRALPSGVRALVRQAGRALAWAPVRIDAVVTGIEVVGQFVEAPHIGAQAPLRRDLAGAVGALFKGVGLGLISVAALAMATQLSVSALVVGVVAWKVALVGAVLFGVGLFVAWLAEFWERHYREQFDPLMEWFPTSSVWGGRALAGVRRDLLEMVSPGYLLGVSAAWDAESGEPSGEPRFPDDMRQQTEGFVDAAYVFPTTAEAERTPGGGGRLTVTVRPLFVRPSGSIPVRVVVSPTLGVPQTSEFVVHYVWVGRFSSYKFLYKVTAEGAPLGLAPGETLKDLALREDWARSSPVDITSRGATMRGDGLRVSLGAWELQTMTSAEVDRLSWSAERADRSVAALARDAEEAEGRLDRAYGVDWRGRDRLRRQAEDARESLATAEAERDRARAAYDAARSKPSPRAHRPLPALFSALLGRPGATVGGGAYFDPAAWAGDPASVPALLVTGEPESIYVAYQRFEGPERR